MVPVPLPLVMRWATAALSSMASRFRNCKIRWAYTPPQGILMRSDLIRRRGLCFRPTRLPEYRLGTRIFLARMNFFKTLPLLRHSASEKTCVSLSNQNLKTCGITRFGAAPTPMSEARASDIGADVYGRLAEAKEAGHMSGSSELQLELSRIVIDGKDYPVVSSDYSLKGKGRGSDTAKKVGGGAVAGAIIGAIAGGGKGAAIGAGVGSAAGAGVQVLTKGQQVKVPSETLLEFRLQQPITVAATQG